MKWLLLAILFGGFCVSGWELRRGILFGRMRFRSGFLEREKSPVAFWVWMATCFLIVLFLLLFVVAATIALWRGLT